MKTNKKLICSLLAGISLGLSLASAGPLVETQVAKDAKWLAHIDMERLLQSSFGDLATAKLKQQIAAANSSKVSVDVDLLLSEIKSITAYGASFAEGGDIDGVLVLQAGDKLQAIVDGFLAHMEMNAEEGEVPFKRLEDKPYDAYLFGEELFVAYPENGVVMASKRFDRIEQAYGVLQGRSASLADAEEALVLNPGPGFFLLASATGLHQLKDVPPQARMLQKTKGGQLSLGEWEGEARANLILTAESREVSLQLYRIVQGMVALASFTQVENQSMMEVVNRVQVRQEGDFVSVDFSYPIEALMELMSGLMQGDGSQGPAPTDDHSALGGEEGRCGLTPAQIGKHLIAAYCSHG